MTNTIKLKPCPFCEGRARIGVTHFKGYSSTDFSPYLEYRVYCPKCRCQTNVKEKDKLYRDKDTVIAKVVEIWNRRVSSGEEK